MHKTMFSTFIIKDILWLISKLFLLVTGWKVIDEDTKNHKKFVMIAAPHTSNWDLPYMLAICFVLKVQPYWMGKSQIFKFPFRGMMKWMGGIPIDRSKANNVVEATAEIMKQSEELIVTIPPEGTRSKVRYWKSGFYHIANLSGVPIVLGFLDYKNKKGGIGGMIKPTGNLEEDMVKIKAFYQSIQGKNTVN
ncbi:MAG: glycerol acyltransferase [Gammaproteobacteria bacterium]|nr:MAG: glycerol acyltransferase [Gammaproteobacteria bacterium]